MGGRGVKKLNLRGEREGEQERGGGEREEKKKRGAASEPLVIAGRHSSEGD